jgi:hypothetical protein
VYLGVEKAPKIGTAKVAKTVQIKTSQTPQKAVFLE